MSDTADQQGSPMTDRRCPECGTLLASATIDLAETPDVTGSTDMSRAEFDPRSMLATDFCPEPTCPRHGTAPDGADGARL
jgi:hypothetical protein